MNAVGFFTVWCITFLLNSPASSFASASTHSPSALSSSSSASSSSSSATTYNSEPQLRDDAVRLSLGRPQCAEVGGIIAPRSILYAYPITLPASVRGYVEVEVTFNVSRGPLVLVQRDEPPTHSNYLHKAGSSKRDTLIQAFEEFELVRPGQRQNDEPSNSRVFYVLVHSSSWFFADSFCINVDEAVHPLGEGRPWRRAGNSLVSLVLQMVLAVGLVAGIVSFFYHRQTDAQIANASLGGAALVFILGVFFLGLGFLVNVILWTALIAGGGFLALQFKERNKPDAKSDSASTSSPVASRPSPSEIQENERVAGLMSSVLSGVEKEWKIKFDELVLRDKVGGGSFGEVYRGEWNGQEVAIKKLMIPMQYIDEAHIQEFTNEVIIMNGLRHPQVILFMGACVEPPDLAIVTEWMNKGSLYAVLHERKEKLEFEILLRMTLQTALGLAYLHSKNVLHRDVKSMNLLVDDNYNVKVADFGLSKMRNAGAFAKTRCGTTNWMAPELLRGEKYTEKADVFSFGVVCWEMFSREVPFRDLSAIEIRASVGRQGKRPPIPESCPKKFAAIIRDCWQSNPNRRPAFTQIVSRLRSYNDQPPSKENFLDTISGRVKEIFH